MLNVTRYTPSILSLLGSDFTLAKLVLTRCSTIKRRYLPFRYLKKYHNLSLLNTLQNTYWFNSMPCIFPLKLLLLRFTQCSVFFYRFYLRSFLFNNYATKRAERYCAINHPIPYHLVS